MGAGITALSLLVTPFLMQASKHILHDGGDTLSPLPTVSRLPVMSLPGLRYVVCQPGPLVSLPGEPTA